MRRALFVVDGRCDGLLTAEDGTVTIEEIKSTVRDIESMLENETPEVHWAQAYFYAYAFAMENSEERLRVRLTYVHVDTEKVRSFEREKTLVELEDYVRDVVEAAYAPYARMLTTNKRFRDESIAGLKFPFAAYREGQRKLAGAVYKTIAEGRSCSPAHRPASGRRSRRCFPRLRRLARTSWSNCFTLRPERLPEPLRRTRWRP